VACLHLAVCRFQFVVHGFKSLELKV
jgi:hypothetical protein